MLGLKEACREDPTLVRDRGLVTIDAAVLSACLKVDDAPLRPNALQVTCTIFHRRTLFSHPSYAKPHSPLIINRSMVELPSLRRYSGSPPFPAQVSRRTDRASV